MKKMNILMTLFCGMIFSLSACSNSTIDVDNTPDAAVVPNPVPVKGAATVFTTTADGLYSLSQTSATINTGTNMAPTTLQLNPSKTYQTMDGFGFALTYSTCYNLMKMTQENRTAFLKRTFSTTEGYGVSYARISIGCCDYASTNYTLCDKEGIENFALQSDETSAVIPVLKEILAINPNLKIIGAPWTCPKWMKVKDLISLSPDDSWTGGHINPKYYDTYAQYFVKFVQAMSKEGINIYAVTPQNEPLNSGNTASTYIPWEEEAPLVKAMAAAFKKNSLKTLIYVFDHNFNYEDVADQDDYPIKVYNALGTNFEGSELVAGAAYHDYGGSNSELNDICAKAPDKQVIFTESALGTWNDGRNLSKRLTTDMNYIALGMVNNNCKAVLVWNMMLDLNGGPKAWDGVQYGAVNINQNNYSALSYNSHYYIICHMSSVVQPGAVRIGTSRAPDKTSFVSSTFVNPDGTYAAVMLNKGDESIKVTVSDGTNYFTVNVPALGIVSCRWNK
jgi:glucosylceramidase